MKKVFLFFLLSSSLVCSQIVKEDLIKTHLVKLSYDEMQGRKAGTSGLEKAATYIESEFERLSLSKFKGSESYRQHFKVQGLELFNVLGFLEGKTKPKEIVVISANYDHLGVNKKLNGDKIYDSDNDIASGVTAVLAIAEHYSFKRTNERSLLFIAFTTVETGLVGSKYFGTTIEPENYIAGINIEMIAKESPFGPNTCWLTGFDRTTMGKIIQKNLAGSEFQVFPDPYDNYNLFYRFDNAALAKLGIPAHTISTRPMNKDLDYNKLTDKAIKHSPSTIITTIRAIIKGIESIVMGRDTPSRPRVTMKIQ